MTQVIHIQETSTGLVDLGHLEFELKVCASIIIDTNVILVYKSRCTYIM